MTEYDKMFKPLPYDRKLCEYIWNDIKTTNEAADAFINLWYKDRPEIEKVIFNNPATIVVWSDGTKTVVKRQDDEPFDREKGLAMAISKKFLGNHGNYYNVFKRFTAVTANETRRSLSNMAKKLAELNNGGREMIINIPLNIPDEILNNALAKDYEDKILQNLTEEVRKCIERRTYSTYDKMNKGLDAYVDDHIGRIVSENKDQIIELAADKLATKLARTKAAKEVVK